MSPSLNTNIAYSEKKRATKAGKIQASVNLAENVKNTCKRKGCSLADVAEKIGVSASSLSQILRGNPTLSKLTDIANALDVPVSDLIADCSPFTWVECPYCNRSFSIEIKAAE